MTGKRGTVKKIILAILGAIVLFIIILFANLIIFGQIESIISKGNPIENYGENNAALLIIDVQEATTGSVSTYPFFQKHADELIQNINNIATHFSDQNIPVIYVRSEISNPLINFLNDSYAKGSLGAQYDRRLKIVSDLEVVKKSKDSFRKTILDSVLISRQVNELYIVGLDAAECVNSTVEAARNRKYRINLIEEAILSKSEKSKDSMLIVFRERGVNVIGISSIVSIR